MQYNTIYQNYGNKNYWGGAFVPIVTRLKYAPSPDSDIRRLSWSRREKRREKSPLYVVYVQNYSTRRYLGKPSRSSQR